MSNNDSGNSNNMSSFVLVADSNGEVEILQVGYETKWKDLCVMLQVKFEYESLPVFTYTDDEEDVICLDSQDALDEAVKICKKNDDVLHVQIRRNGTLPPRVQRFQSSPSETRKPVITSDRIEMARAAMGNTIGWATNAVKSAFSRNVSTDPVSEETCKKESQPSSYVEMQTVEVPDETDSEPVLHEVDQSFQTNVKEVVESELYDISVPTSIMNDSDDDDESEVIVKEPLPSTSEQSRKQIDPIMLQSIREEVRTVISQELQTFRHEVSAGLTQSVYSKQFEDGDNPGTSRDDAEERPRSPTEIKEDIRKLKIEMKEAKQVRKIKKQNEKSLKRRSHEKGVMVPPLHSQENESKKVRKYAASFICENLIDGSFVGVGQQFVKYWVLKNEGTITWDEQIQLKLVDEKLTEDSSSVDPKTANETRIDPRQLQGRCGPEKVSLGMPIIESGKTAVLAVTHVAPSLPCVYTSAWRLCHSDKFFGPRIWCSVAVRSHIDSSSLVPDESLSLIEQVSDQSYMSKNWEPTRKVSTEEPMGADDDLSNMLSFEMTAVGDFNKETPSMEHHSNSYNFAVSYPPQRSQSASETPTEITEAEVVEAQNVSEPVTQPETPVPEPEELVEQSEETPEKPAEEHEESVVVLDDYASGLNFHSIPHPEEIPEEDVEEEEQEEVQEPEVLDTEEQEDMDDTHSVLSDFEVIPLPECFDTSKPLSSLEKEEQEKEAERMRNHLSNLTTQAQYEELEYESLPPPPAVTLVAMDANEEPLEENEEEEESDEEEQPDQTQPEMVEVPSSSQPSTSSADKSVAPACLPVPQSVLDMDKPASTSTDYSTGYQTPVQKTAPPEEPWIPQPIPLPRGVLDADKPWTKSDTFPKSVPLPHPRSSSQLQAMEADATEEIQTAHADSPSIEVAEEVDSPRIIFPPMQDAEEVDEFTLAPEAPVDSPPLPILVPPGYPVPPPHIPSQAAAPQPPVVPPQPRYPNLPPPGYPVLPPHIPRQAAAPVPPVPPQEHEPTPIEQLVDMGFLDIDLNEDLLKEFGGDVNKTVHALVYRGAGAEERPRRRGRGNNRGIGSFLA